ncbi:thiamine pyrophosphate-binding protein [Polymorphum gilvum]|uniref:Acetolactate synthase large subunit n=1 Tax=Polymorphum gilvum (strain LMG 25793 / CGMCC 1.9160 / SL003B-26A1) TaxID=991905 RepID=F2J2N6_POLGS|nr:thiamine pyrophosphate-binding protein [Polymorphum gilvum]ADZ70950.1 Acetolactate synthase large subunit [Polymorphum gilvum SL003B-26A1]
MAVRKGGDLIAEFLVKEKIPYVFGICGHGNVGLLDSLYDVRDEVKLVSPRHEQTAAHMADGFFRVSHSPAATLTSTGPGSANLIMGLAVAQTDSSAILSITANVPTSQFNRGPFQELNQHHQADFNNVIKPVVKRSFQPTRVEMLPLAMRQAAQTMTTGRPGPVNLDIPYNLFLESADVKEESAWAGFNLRRSGASDADVSTVCDWLLAAERPVLFIGHGVTLSEAGSELVALAERLSIPVISSPNGMGCIDMRHELSLGFIGRNGAYQANQAGRHADLVLAVGARFDDRSASSWMPGYSWNFPHTRLVHVDVDHAEIGRNYPPDLGILADAQAFLRQVLAELDRRSVGRGSRNEKWLNEIKGWKAEWETFVQPGFETHARPIRPERIVADVRKVLPDDGILTLDSGIHHNWFMQFWQARRPQSMLNTWGYSGMGFGPSAALGAKLAAPDRPVVSVCGDGGFTMVPHVLCTAVEYDIPVVWVVWNNFAWGAIRDLQYAYFGGREYGTAFYQGPNREPYNPDFAAWARASGVDGYTVTRSQDFAGVLEQAIAANRPALIDVHVDADIRPPATGAWELPPIVPKPPVYGRPWRPGDTN